MKNPFSGMFSRTSTSSIASTKHAPPLLALQLANTASWTPRHYTALAREGFQRNPIAYRCIRMIAESAASIHFKTENAHVQSVLSQGYTGVTATDVMESFYGYLLVSGNAYLEAGLISEMPRVLYALRPDRLVVQSNADGWPCGYEYDVGGRRRYFRCDPASGRTALFHMRLFHPLNETIGFSPLEAAAQAVDIHNEGGRWTKALLDNSARPSGALIFQGSDAGQHLSNQQYERLKTELEETYSGSRHAGRPMVLEGGLEWKSMSLSPADMDFLEARREAAREISLALGVPPMLLGIPGDNTYANYKEANQAFRRHTVMPLVKKTARGLQGWLRPWFGDELTIAPDPEDVSALNLPETEV